MAEGTSEYVDKLLANFAPKEVLIMRGMRQRFEGFFGGKFFIFELEDWTFNESTAKENSASTSPSTISRASAWSI